MCERWRRDVDVAVEIVAHDGLYEVLLGQCAPAGVREAQADYMTIPEMRSDCTCTGTVKFASVAKGGRRSREVVH
jgi:hypothetical protein